MVARFTVHLPMVLRADYYNKQVFLYELDCRRHGKTGGASQRHVRQNQDVLPRDQVVATAREGHFPAMQSAIVDHQTDFPPEETDLVSKQTDFASKETDLAEKESDFPPKETGFVGEESDFAGEADRLGRRKDVNYWL